MNIYQKRIENLCGEITRRILALMRINSVPEVILTDHDNPVFVVWFDKTGDPCECSVHKVAAAGEGITLEVHDKITGENYKVTSRHEAALANPVWLNEILEVVTAIFPTKDIGPEEEVICCSRGGNDVICDAFINPMKSKMLKIGDKIRIKKEGFFEEFPVMPNHTIRCYGLDVTPEMRKFWGREATVVEIDITGESPMYSLSIDSGKHWWNIEMLELDVHAGIFYESNTGF